MPLKMTVRSRLLDMYAYAGQNYQLVSFHKEKNHCLVFPFRGVWGSFWKYIWLILIFLCAGCGEWQIFHLSILPDSSQEGSTQHQHTHFIGSSGIRSNGISADLCHNLGLWTRSAMGSYDTAHLGLKTSKDEESTVYLGNLLPIFLMEKESFSLYLRLSELAVSHPPTMHHCGSPAPSSWPSQEV